MNTEKRSNIHQSNQKSLTKTKNNIKAPKPKDHVLGDKDLYTVTKSQNKVKNTMIVSNTTNPMVLNIYQTAAYKPSEEQPAVLDINGQPVGIFQTDANEDSLPSIRFD